ncbi:MAG: hypothetical protein HFG15_03070 [Bacilli bacterium]|jgi:hypothetical protein|nr:hypothetical protein [Bacilli bacterium]
MRYAKKNQKRLLIISAALFVICIIALGYAAISSSIKINGVGTISTNWDILFTSIEENGSKQATTNHKEITDKLSAVFDVTLEVPGSYVEYMVVLKNNGNMDAVIESIGGITEANEQEPTGIQFQVKDINIGDKLLAGTEKQFLVRAEIPVEETILPTGNKTLELTINVRQKGGNSDPEKPSIFDIEEPVIQDGMIPVTFDTNGNTVKANTDSLWYNYDNKKWANAVSVTSSSRNSYQNAEPGTAINEEDILGYFVWIPRYRYQLWNAENGVSDEQEIKIRFEKKETLKSQGNQNGEWLTHPAFTFGSTELAGIWVGKFEMTGDSATPTIKPNRRSLTNLDNKTTFDTIRKLSTTSTYGLSSYDSHMIKNMEWGAVAYLTQSMYGRCTNGTCTEVWINNVNTGTTSVEQCVSTITGCSGASVSASTKSNMTACEAGRDYKQAGVNASTTGNITGIYDMSGGTWERTMGVLKDESGNIAYANSGFNASNMPASKYYDLYEKTSQYHDYDFTKGKLGDATREIVKKNETLSGSWYNDQSFMPIVLSPWTTRSGSACIGSSTGVFFFSRHGGGAATNGGSRAVVVFEN